MKKSAYIILTLLAMLLAACDDGRIYPKTATDTAGRTARLTGTITGTEHWAPGYSIALAGFTADEDNYASISKVVQPDADGSVTTTLSNIPDNVKTIQLCVLDRLRQHVSTLYEVQTEGQGDIISMDIGTVNASMLQVIQQDFFNTTCARCHGENSERIAAGLDLTAGKSYQALVGTDSRRVAGLKLVAPGDAANSVLHLVLNEERVDGIGMSHKDLVSERNAENILPLIDSWINHQAPEH